MSIPSLIPMESDIVTTQRAVENAEPLGFLDFPGEMRNKIYGYLLPNPEHPVLFRMNKDSEEAPEIDGYSQEKLPLAMYRTCKTIHNEFTPLRALLGTGAIIPVVRFYELGYGFRALFEIEAGILAVASHLCIMSVTPPMRAVGQEESMHEPFDAFPEPAWYTKKTSHDSDHCVVSQFLQKSPDSTETAMQDSADSRRTSVRTQQACTGTPVEAGSKTILFYCEDDPGPMNFLCHGLVRWLMTDIMRLHLSKLRYLNAVRLRLFDKPNAAASETEFDKSSKERLKAMMKRLESLGEELRKDGYSDMPALI